MCVFGADGNDARVEGRVINSLNGEPVRKAIVELTAADGPIHLVADSDGSGRFEFSGLPAGRYQLSGRRTGFLPQRAKQQFTLAAGGRMTARDLRLRPHSVVAGRVLDEDGEPSPDAAVSVFRQNARHGRKEWTVAGRTKTDDSGAYRLAGLTPGKYLIQAWNQRPSVQNRYRPANEDQRPERFYIPVYFPNAATQREASPVDVGVGAEVSGLDIHLFQVARPALVHVRGRVAGVPSNAQDEVGVSLRSTDETPFGGNSTVAPAPGFPFDLTAAPGRYELHVYLRSGDRGVQGSTNLTVAGDTDGVVVTMSPAPVVTGRVVVAGERGTDRVKGVRVDLEDPARGESVGAEADAAGRLTFSRALYPGRHAVYRVRSMPEGCFLQAVKFGGMVVDAEDFLVSASGELEFVLSPTAGTVAGSVANDQDRPAAAARVTLIPEDGRPGPDPVTADEAGRFRIAGLRPGRYRVFAWAEMEDDLWQDADFRAKYEKQSTALTVRTGDAQNTTLRVIPLEQLP